MKTLVKIDKNGSKHYIEDECPRCHGTGRYGTYGVCFKCNGSGKYEHTIIERTLEYEEKLADKRQERAFERAKAQAPIKNEKLFKWNNLGENGDVWIVLGNTYPIKDELKADGARFNQVFGWYFNKPYDKYPVEKINGDIFLNELETGELEIDWLAADKVVQKIKNKYNDEHRPVSNSEWVGEIGDKIYTSAIVKRVNPFTSSFNHVISFMAWYTFEDTDKNILKWKTKEIEIEDENGEVYLLQEGDIIELEGKVKEHTEFRGEKQTVLTRCRIHPVELQKKSE